MKKKNGFTLIELLAVIVILAIIALIATPIVLNLIEKARQGAAKDSAYGVRKAGQLYYQALLLDDIGGINGSITVSFDNGVITSSVNNSDVEYKLDGTIPKSGSITITNDGEISGTVIINGYTCPITNSGTISCTKGEELTPVTYKKYENGEIVYYNPITNKFCSNYNVDNSITEYKGDTTSKTTDNQTGCLKWYAYLDSEDSETVNLLLDHNTTARIQWNADNNNVPLEESNLQAELNSLKNDSNWVLQPTIISAYDVALITDYAGINGVDWDTTTAFKFDTGSQNSKSFNLNIRSDYYYLYDYTFKCKSDSEDYGCKIEDNALIYRLNNNNLYDNGSYTDGYWTSTKASNGNVWRITKFSNLGNSTENTTYYGLRPVVTVNKNIGHDGTSRVYYNGEIVYFNPVTNTQCYNYVEDNSTTGYKGENDPNKTESQNGCMRWFAYLDNGNATDLKLLADHNTTATIKWYDTAEYKTLEESNLQTELDNLVDDNVYDWNVPTTIISANDIALITDYAGTNGVEWDSSNRNNSFCFDTNTSSNPEVFSGTYWWLYDRTFNCQNYGCVTSDDSNVGYSTSNTIESSTNLWRVAFYCKLDTIAVTDTNGGLRPVITISKSLLD